MRSRRAPTLVWSSEQIDPLAAAQRDDVLSAIVPLTPQAMGRVLALRLPCAFSPLELLDLEGEARTLWAQARARADALVKRSKPDNDASDYEAALERLLFLLDFREILHLRSVLERVRTRFDAPPCDWVLPKWTMQERERGFFLRAAFAEAGFLRDDWPDMPPPAAPAQRLSSFPDADFSGGILISTFGMSDIRGTLRRLRKETRAPLTLLAGRAHSHLEALRSDWASYQSEFGRIELLCPPIEPARSEDGEPAEPGASADRLLERKAAREWRPSRESLRALTRRLAEVRDFRRVVMCDHLSDAGLAVAMTPALAAAEWEVETHSGLPLGPDYWSPPYLKRGGGRLICWTPQIAERLARAAPATVPPWRAQAHSPRSFKGEGRARRLAREARLTLRHPVIGLLPTTGQSAFAPDIAWRDWIEGAKQFVQDGVRAGARFRARLRDGETNEDLYAALLGLEGLENACIFSTMREASLGRFLSQVDVCVELGQPSSAAFAAIARSILVFRLKGNGRSGVEALPLPEVSSYAELAESIRFQKRRNLLKVEMGLLGAPLFVAPSVERRA